MVVVEEVDLCTQTAAKEAVYTRPMQSRHTHMHGCSQSIIYMGSSHNGIESIPLRLRSTLIVVLIRESCSVKL